MHKDILIKKRVASVGSKYLSNIIVLAIYYRLLANYHRLRSHVATVLAWRGALHQENRKWRTKFSSLKVFL